MGGDGGFKRNAHRISGDAGNRGRNAAGAHGEAENSHLQVLFTGKNADADCGRIRDQPPCGEGFPFPCGQ